MAGYFLRDPGKELTRLQETVIIMMDDVIISWKADNKAMLTI